VIAGAAVGRVAEERDALARALDETSLALDAEAVLGGVAARPVPGVPFRDVQSTDAEHGLASAGQCAARRDDSRDDE
jgi:hypothetical protein